MYIERARLFLEKLDASEMDRFVRHVIDHFKDAPEDVDERNEYREKIRKNIRNFINGANTSKSNIEAYFAAIDKLPGRDTISVLSGIQLSWQESMLKSALNKIPSKYFKHFDDENIRDEFIKFVRSSLSICYDERKTYFEKNLTTFNQFLEIKKSKK
ncbi:hypothetical protein [Ammoniphilus sp. CFH 90114]|uniref:hypothetical protein n=1 Tax=Ammoniphilus sp. CFH 90114 TaxID=2493665 RepID=UPI00100F2D32|nr:hypothetical protein [Ammoniphilus sp. CFH 90114]RXT03554.1 hypothetical protein EIZ39_23775 [Ammoniphilus sp. CFH 90114]